MQHHSAAAANAQARRRAIEMIPIGEATELEVYEAPTFPMELDDDDARASAHRQMLAHRAASVASPDLGG